MYVKRVYEYGNIFEIEKFHTWEYQSKKHTRSYREKKTPEAMQKVNQRNAVKKFNRIVNANFSCGDYHVILTYDQYHKTSDSEIAKKDLKKYIRRLRAAAKKKGCQLKYVSVTETSPKTGIALHHHLIIKNIGIEPSILAYMWDNGHAKFVSLDEAGDYTELANYFLKQANKTKTDIEPAERELPNKKRWNASKNLVYPEPKETVVGADDWRKEPSVPKGYILIPESVSIGVNEYTGYAYQYYKCRKVLPEDKHKRYSLSHIERLLELEGEKANE